MLILNFAKFNCKKKSFIIFKLIDIFIRILLKMKEIIVIFHDNPKGFSGLINRKDFESFMKRMIVLKSI